MNAAIDAKTARKVAENRRYIARSCVVDLLRSHPMMSPGEIYDAARRTNVPYSSMRRAVQTLTRAGIIGAREVAGVRRYFVRRAMVATPEQVVAWEDSDGRILFDTVRTRGAFDARWVNDPGATPRQPDDEE